MRKYLNSLSMPAKIIVAIALIIVTVVSVAFATSSVNCSGDMCVGSTTATGAAINVSLGWTPKYVIVSNPATTVPANMEWSTGMAAASALRTVASGTNSEAIMSRVTVSGISVYSGGTTTPKGFTIGADTVVNISGDTLYYRAFR